MVWLMTLAFGLVVMLLGGLLILIVIGWIADAIFGKDNAWLDYGMEDEDL